MGCNCKKKPEVIEPTPQTPDELLAQELKEWNGGPVITGDTQTNNNGQIRKIKVKLNRKSW